MGLVYNPQTMRMEFLPDYGMTQRQQPTTQGFTWVQGEAGAKSFIVNPNSTALLMDSEAQRFYLKSADASGMPTMKAYSFTEISPQEAQESPLKVEPNNYPTRAEFDDLKAKFEAYISKDEKPARKKKEADNE